MDKSKIRTPGQKCRFHCRQLYNSIFQYRNIDGIQLIDMFMHKPSKRDYPDYYDVSKILSLLTEDSLNFARYKVKQLFYMFQNFIADYQQPNGYENNRFEYKK